MATSGGRREVDWVRHGVRCHELRDCEASLLIRHGESVKTVQARLRDAFAVERLHACWHPWPDSEDRTRTAVDEVLGARVSPSCHTAGSAN